MAVVGPTATGKTAVGIALAERVGGEIVSADAVAVYRGLDIGAAKPTKAEQARVRFHLLDVVDPAEDFTVADFARLAEDAIGEIRARGNVPILVGGTGLYVRAVTATLALPAVAPQPELRARLTEEAERDGTPALHARLAAQDPLSAARILPNDRKRIIRALEVQAVTGQPLSAFHTPEGVRGVPRPNTALFGLTRDRETLYARIEARVDAMLTEGFLDEVRERLAAGHGPDLKSMQSLGYRHLAAHLTQGHSWETTIAELKRDTRRYAKRQLSWFKADPSVRWVEAEGREAGDIAGELARILSMTGQEDFR